MLQEVEPEPLIVAHGACPEGADKFAHAWCVFHPTAREVTFPADWKTHRRAAGFVRNREMVLSGADLVVAFCDWCDKIECPRHDTEGDHMSHGTENCVKEARGAGIEVIEFWATP